MLKEDADKLKRGDRVLVDHTNTKFTVASLGKSADHIKEFEAKVVLVFPGNGKYSLITVEDDNGVSSEQWNDDISHIK